MYNQVEIAGKVVPCLRCGGDQVEVIPSVYYSVQFASVDCLGCGESFTGKMYGSWDTNEAVRNIWNEYNHPQARMLKIIDRLDEIDTKIDKILSHFAYVE